MRISDNMAITRATDMTAARARDIQQTGLTAGTLREINRNAEEDLRTVRDRPEVEGAIVRTDAESENNAAQEQAKREREETPPSDEDGDLRRRASEHLLNLPVTKRKDTTVEARRFDIRV